MGKITIDASKIKILICCHKPCELPKDDIFLPIQVGAAISDIDLGMQRDDKVNGQPCDNISAKNKSYCELTAMYWAWKNIKKIYPNLEYIGLNHYRRYFRLDKKNGLRDLYISTEKDVHNYVFNINDAMSILRKYDAIISKKKQYQYPLYIDYSVCHISDDLRTLHQIIIDKYPEYELAFDNFFMRNGALSHYNMSIMRVDLFNSYCTWLFGILAEMECKTDISKYNSVQKRIFGYIAERLWNVYIEHNSLNVKELPVAWFVDDKKQMPLFKYMGKKIWAKISVSILKCLKKPNFF